MNEFTTTTLTMVRDFNVNCEKVFDAWLNPDLMSKWLFTLENTNKVTQNNPKVGGSWEIVDHREGMDFRAIGKYLEVALPKIRFTFKMPQFSELEDLITVELNQRAEGCKMTFTHVIHVPHEKNWAESDIKTALIESHDSTKEGWNYMFMGLKELVETGENSYKG